MRQRVFGHAVTAGDVEALAPDVGPTDFVRLCGALVGAALADRVGAFTLPEITERITVPDGGVDALYVAPPLADVSESGGLVGPGTTVYQFKYRDVRRGRREVVTELATTRDEFAKVARHCDRYALLTNVDLSRASRTRLRQQFLDACPAFASKTLVIWGASELATQINLVPQLRQLFISDGRLCTLDVAEQEHRALWERRGWPGFVGRREELEAIESFLDSREARVLRLAGVRHAGKTRLALGALRSRATQVVWASSPESATIELFRDLDEGGRGVVLVVDGCTRRGGDEVAELARARRQLKTVVIEEGGEAAASVDQLTFLIGPLDEEDARHLVAEVTPGLAFTQASWIVEAAGRLPGLLVEIAALVREMLLSPTGRPGVMRQQLDTLLESLYLFPIAGDVALRQALGVLALLPEVGVDGNVGGELDALCRALDVKVDEIRSRIGILVRHGLVRRRGRFVEVIPPSLAERLAGETLGRPDLRVAELLAALEPPAFVRFLRRLRDLARPEVAGTIEQLLGRWFPDSESVVRNAHVLRTLAPAAPAVALHCLENGLGTLSSAELRERLAGDARRDIVETLARLAHLPETFDGASRLLLSLAEAENERWDNNATGEFVSMFAGGHPEVSASLAQRATFLREHAGSPSPERRRLIGRACGEGLSPRSTVAYHSPAGPEVPPRPALPNTWGELWSYQSLLLGVARRLSEDADPGVRDVATDAIVNGFADIVRGTMTRERLEEPGGAAFEALGHVARSTGRARVRERAVTRLEVLLDNLNEQQTDAGAALAEVKERASGCLRELTEGELKDELWRWVGPRSQHVLKLEVAGNDEPSRRLRQVARRVSEDLPQLSIHLTWLLGEEAEKRTAFFEALGEALAESGQAEAGLDRLTAQADSPAWPQVLGGFCLGWARRDPTQVETALDRLLESSGTWKGVLVASACFLPSSAAMRRLGKLVERTEVTRVEFARELAWSAPWNRLEADEAAQLLRTIDDGSREVRERLLVALGLSALRSAELSSGLLELSWSFLESTIPETRESGWRPWDMLASRLVDTDPLRVLALLKTALREHLEVVLRFEGAVPLTWSRLVSKDRAGLVRAMLEAMLGRDPSITASWTLRGLVRPLEDREMLLGFVGQAGVEGARLVAGALEGGRPGFWELARDLLAMSGGDQGVQAGLNRSVLSGTWSGSRVPWIESRLAGARDLASAADMVVSSWARGMVSTLERWRMEEEQRDDEPWIWETRMQRREVEGLLARADSPERLWAIGRLLADAPRARVQELLSADDILDALPRLPDVPEKKRREWETWARHWSGRH